MLYQLPTTESLRYLLLEAMGLILAPYRSNETNLQIASKLAMARRMKDGLGISEAAYSDMLHQASLDYREMVAAYEANIPQDEPPCNVIPGFYPEEVENPLKPW